MVLTEDDLFRFLDELGIETTTVRHPPVHTVEEAKALRGELPGGHCKSLFLKTKKGALYLVVALEDTPVDLKALGRHLECGRISFGKPELLSEVLGVIPGAVTPFGAINDAEARVGIILDARMLATRPLNYHPLDNRATTAIAPEDLVRFLEATGHSPRIVDLGRL